MIIAICSEKTQKHSYFTVAESDLQLHWNLHFMSSLIIFKYFRNYVFFALPALHVSPSKVVTLPSGIPHFGPKNTESEHAPTGVLDPLNRNSLSWWGGAAGGGLQNSVLLQDRFGNTALHMAVIHDLPAMYDFLLLWHGLLHCFSHPVRFGRIFSPAETPVMIPHCFLFLDLSQLVSILFVFVHVGVVCLCEDQLPQMNESSLLFVSIAENPKE